MNIPVLIAGAGPTGLAMSLLLSRHGVPSLLVERHPGTSTHPKATGLSTRTMELLRSWGIDAAVRAQAMPRRARRFGLDVAGLARVISPSAADRLGCRHRRRRARDGLGVRPGSAGTDPARLCAQLPRCRHPVRARGCVVHAGFVGGDRTDPRARVRGRDHCASRLSRRGRRRLEPSSARSSAAAWPASSRSIASLHRSRNDSAPGACFSPVTRRIR